MRAKKGVLVENMTVDNSACIPGGDSHREECKNWSSKAVGTNR